MKGVEIEVLQKGNGMKPVNGKKVRCHYTLTLKNGTKVDSSRDRNKVFEFTLGKKQVIAGWEYAIGEMVVGDRCKVTIQPEHGYGDKGVGGTIPPGAVLYFDVELLGIVDAC